MNLYMISLKLLIFNSHVKLPEGMSILHSPPSFLELFAGCWWINPAVWVGLLKLAVGKPSGPVLEWPRNRAYTDLCHIDLYYPLFRMIHHISSLFSVHSDHSGNLHVNLVRTCRCKKDVWMQLIIHPESAYISKWMRPQRERERYLFQAQRRRHLIATTCSLKNKSFYLGMCWDLNQLWDLLHLTPDEDDDDDDLRVRCKEGCHQMDPCISSRLHIYIYVCSFGNLT